MSTCCKVNIKDPLDHARLLFFYCLPFFCPGGSLSIQSIMFAHIQPQSRAMFLIYHHLLRTNIRPAFPSSIILLISLHTVRCNLYCIFHSFFPSSFARFKSPWMEPGLQCTIFPATVAVVLGPVQPHYFWEPNSHGPRNRRASSAVLALFPGIVSFVTSRAAFQPVNVCAGRSEFPVFSFRKGNLKFRIQSLFSHPQIMSLSPLFLLFLLFVVIYNIMGYTAVITP